MSPRCRILALVALLTFVLIAAVACSGAPAPSAQVAPGASEAPAVAPAEPAVAPAQPAAAPTPAPAFPEPQSGDLGSVAGSEGEAAVPTMVPSSGSPSNRKIIKDAEMNLVVDQIVRAVDRVTTIAANAGGYILSTELSAQGEGKTATVKLGVPSEAFEDVLRQIRGTALQVKWERATGSDVTSEYVDLQSQLTNLKATQARLRQFLDQAKTVEEALQVNAELSKVEGEIETIQGRINYLGSRSAYSSITLYLEQLMPTPTVTPTPTITPTPSATPTATPIVWHPGETFGSARITLQYVLRGMGDFAIWAGVVCVPLVIIGLIVLLPVMWIRRRTRRRHPDARPSPAPGPEGAPRPPEDKQ
jgi:hypothetical protein